MKNSHRFVLAATLGAAGVAATVVFVLVDPFGIAGGPGDGDAGPAAAKTASVDELRARVNALESQMRRSRARAASPASIEPADGTPAEPDEDEALELAERVDDIEERLRGIEAHVRALSADPVSRGFEYVASENADLRRRGIEMLQRMARSDPQALAAIRGLLADPEAAVRREALEALEEVGDRESIPGILGLLADPESAVRAQAIESVTDLLDDIDGADPQVATAALSVSEMLADPDPRVRRSAAEALGQFEGPTAVPALLESLADADDDVRGEAIDSLADMRAETAAPRLREMYDRDPGPHRMDLAMALRRLGDPAPYQSEVARLSQLATASANEEERRRAIRDLGRFEAAELKPLFERALEDASPRVRREAEEAIEDIDD